VDSLLVARLNVVLIDRDEHVHPRESSSSPGKSNSPTAEDNQAESGDDSLMGTPAWEQSLVASKLIVLVFVTHVTFFLPSPAFSSSLQGISQARAQSTISTVDRKSDRLQTMFPNDDNLDLTNPRLESAIIPNFFFSTTLLLTRKKRPTMCGAYWYIM